MSQFRISAKNRGELAFPDFCPRCFWLRTKAKNKLPFQIFPGIFSSIDAYTKRVVHAWIDQNGGAPEHVLQPAEAVWFRQKEQ